MPLSEATISYDLADLGGVDFDARRTKVWATTNVASDTVIDTDGNKIRLGSTNGTIAADGTGSIVVWTPGTGSNPASWQTYIHVDYPDRNKTGGRGKRTFGPFTISASANLADLVAEMEVPPEYLTTVTQQLDAKVAEADASATDAATSAALAKSVAEIDTPDALVATLVQDSGSDTGAALSATFAPGLTAPLSASATGAENRAALDAAKVEAITKGRILYLPAGAFDIAGDEVLIDSALTIVGPGSGRCTLTKTTKARAIFKVTAPGCEFRGFKVKGQGLDVTGHPLNGADSFRRHVGIWATLTAHDLTVDDVAGEGVFGVTYVRDFFPGEASTYSSPGLRNLRFVNVACVDVWCGVEGGPLIDPHIENVTGNYKAAFGTPTNGDTASPPHLVYINSDTTHRTKGGVVKGISSADCTDLGGPLKIKHADATQVDGMTSRNTVGAVEMEETTDVELRGIVAIDNTYPQSNGRGAVWQVNCSGTKIIEPVIKFASGAHGSAFWENSATTDTLIVRPRVTMNRSTADTANVNGINSRGVRTTVRQPVVDSVGAAIGAGVYMDSVRGTVENPATSGPMLHGVYARSNQQLITYDPAVLVPSRSYAGALAVAQHADAVTASTVLRDLSIGQPVPTGFTDTFNRVDVDTVGHTDNFKAWERIALEGPNLGTWRIIGNAVQFKDGTARGVLLAEGGKADGTLTGVVGSLPTTGPTGLVVRCLDANNYVGVNIYLGAGDFRIQLMKRVAGAGSQIAIATAAAQVGDSIAIVMAGTSISVKRNGVEVIAPQTVTDFATATKHGFVGGGSGTAKFDSVTFA